LMMVVLSFLINFVREIAKDVEDESGDSIAGYQTLVIKYGKKAAKIMMLCLIFITMLVCGIWIFFTSISLTLQQVAMMGLFIIAPLGVAIQILTSSTHKRNMSDLSALLRWILLAGVITCLTFSQSLPGEG
jgi:4-hydroxybenzoate polyprenyltransferase